MPPATASALAAEGSWRLPWEEVSGGEASIVNVAPRPRPFQALRRAVQARWKGEAAMRP